MEHPRVDPAPESSDSSKRSAFTRALLRDLQALERMIEEGLIETGIQRIGAEQEMFLVDRSLAPAPVAGHVLEEIADPRFTGELARFNLEANLTPRVFRGSCLHELELELNEVVSLTRAAMRLHGGDVALVGILPTLRKSDASMENMTPTPRYVELNKAMLMDRGAEFEIHIKGLDELQTTHDNVMLESGNTSFQIHLQVAPREFASYYNAAQVVTAPVLAAGAFSPVLLRHRLWAETRIALFERSVDDRSRTHQARGHPARVTFGDRWIKDSVLEIFRDDVARFRVIRSAEITHDPLASLDRGEVPNLPALGLHNGTIYRWNRPCFGVQDGVAHLRIENRVLPSGPTVVDEVANAAFFWGLLQDIVRNGPRVDQVMSFDDAKCNFFAAARQGLDAQLVWFDGQSHSVGELILDELLPRARQGLANTEIDPADATRYLDLMEERIRRRRTGTRWMIHSLAAMKSQGTAELRHSSLSAALIAEQRTGRPVHEWPLAPLRHESGEVRHSVRVVGQVMSTDLFTVRPDDIIDLAASVMGWRRIRHIPVENDEGALTGLISYWSLMRMVARGASQDPVLAESIMQSDPPTVTPETPTRKAMELMEEHRVDCLPVVEDGRLVGIITERDLFRVARRLLEDYLDDS